MQLLRLPVPDRLASRSFRHTCRLNSACQALPPAAVNSRLQAASIEGMIAQLRRYVAAGLTQEQAEEVILQFSGVHSMTLPIIDRQSPIEGPVARMQKLVASGLTQEQAEEFVLQVSELQKIVLYDVDQRFAMESEIARVRKLVAAGFTQKVADEIGLQYSAELNAILHKVDQPFMQPLLKLKQYQPKLKGAFVSVWETTITWQLLGSALFLRLLLGREGVFLVALWVVVQFLKRLGSD